MINRFVAVVIQILISFVSLMVPFDAATGKADMLNKYY